MPGRGGGEVGEPGPAGLGLNAALAVVFMELVVAEQDDHDGQPELAGVPHRLVHLGKVVDAFFFFDAVPVEAAADDAKAQGVDPIEGLDREVVALQLNAARLRHALRQGRGTARKARRRRDEGHADRQRDDRRSGNLQAGEWRSVHDGEMAGGGTKKGFPIVSSGGARVNHRGVWMFETGIGESRWPPDVRRNGNMPWRTRPAIL